MPQIQVSVTAAKEVWKSPDGQRTINEVTLDYNGSPVTAKTYSSDIAVVGWSGTVETYEKPGRNGIETFVKQPPKEGGFGQSQSHSSTGTGGSKYSAKPQGDQFTMYLSYAKDIAVAMIMTAGTISPDEYRAALDRVADGGELLFNKHNNPGAVTEDMLSSAEVDGISKEDLNNLFPDDEATVEGEKQPWPPKK